MKLVIATNNRNKLREIKEIFSDMALPGEIEVLSLADFRDVPEIVEDGATLEENAVKKARVISEFTGLAAFADDTGLEVDKLNGEPGVYSARFAGEQCSYEDNNNKLLSLLEGVPEKDRGARFRCVIAVVVPGGKTYTVEGEMKGAIAISPKGANGFGYDPIFVPEGQGRRTFSEMSSEEKNNISHRSAAVRKSKEVLLEISGKSSYNK
ncbi:MAG: non-canonical purine NTP pyrophosphatase, RdgB/HAM1 family [Elusimicrobia bacterium RIFOXYB2_FULL_48_7]|nr:MAG: non-canonical purine NTP pyrophosphatase, RdgB/HAM1 family [Elusimicrobia bacterium RIFOXYB2_FULL_48_7]